MKEIQKNDYQLKHRLDALDRRIDGGGIENTDVDLWRNIPGGHSFDRIDHATGTGDPLQ